MTDRLDGISYEDKTMEDQVVKVSKRQSDGWKTSTLPKKKIPERETVFQSL